MLSAETAASPAVVDRSGDTSITSLNPADGSVAGVVRRATVADVDAAVARAWTAFKTRSWRHLRLDRRADTLYEIGRRILLERETLARLQMADSGKPLKECQHMVDSAAGTFRYYAAVCETLQGELTPARGDYFSMAVSEPFGVIAAITPWN
jgi:betaine-aldehyde dehydrogenase